MTFVVTAYVGINYEHLVVKYGLIDPKEHKKKKRVDFNPLPMELRDEYVLTTLNRSTRSRKSTETQNYLLERLSRAN